MTAEPQESEMLGEVTEQAYYAMALAGKQIVEPRPLTEEEQELIEKLKGTDIIHWFGRGNCPALANVDTNPNAYIPTNRVGIEPRRLTSEEIKLFKERAWTTGLLTEDELKVVELARFSPTNSSLHGGEFLAVLVRAGLATNEQIKAMFNNPPENFNAINWTALNWQRWPDIKEGGEGLAALAKLLGKLGVQRYAWDGGYGDVSESWRTVFVQEDGKLLWENTQAYGSMRA